MKISAALLLVIIIVAAAFAAPVVSAQSPGDCPLSPYQSVWVGGYGNYNPYCAGVVGVMWDFTAPTEHQWVCTLEVRQPGYYENGEAQPLPGVIDPHDTWGWRVNNQIRVCDPYGYNCGWYPAWGITNGFQPR